ncbi:MAG: AsmA family protein, partial [Deltaproteobacteria bacterium]
MRWIKRFIFVLVVLGLAAGAFLIWLPAGKIAQLAAERFSQSTGRKLTISGDVSATLWPTIGVTANAVTLENADWGKANTLISAEKVYIGIDPMTIFSDEIGVRSLELSGAKVNLERRGDGVGNWSFAQAGSGGTRFAIDHIGLSD